MKLTSRSVAALLLACVALNAATAQASLLASEAFEYSGTALNGQDGGFGWNGAWTQFGANPSIQLSNDGVSLGYPVPFEPPLTTPSVSGSRVSHGGGTGINSSYRLLADPIDLSVQGTVAYISVLIRKNAANGGGENNDNILLEFMNSNEVRRWGIGITGNGDLPWTTITGTAQGATAVTPGETYFMVARIESLGAGNTNVRSDVWVFGDNYRSEVPIVQPLTPDFSLTQPTGAILDRLRIRIDGGNPSNAPGEVDQIRIGTTWASVIPEPTSWALAMGALASAAVLRRRRR